MDMIGKLRRMKLRDRLSDREIFSRTGLARNTVKNWLKTPGVAVRRQIQRYLTKAMVTKAEAS